MQSVYQIDEDHGLVCILAWGIVSYSSIIKHREALEADLRFKPSFKGLVDLTRCQVQVTPKEIQLLAHPHHYSRESHRAILASTEVSFGLSRMFEAYADVSGGASNLRVCRSLSEAIEWLEVPEGVIIQLISKLETLIPL